MRVGFDAIGGSVSRATSGGSALVADSATVGASRAAELASKRAASDSEIASAITRGSLRGASCARGASGERFTHFAPLPPADLATELRRDDDGVCIELTKTSSRVSGWGSREVA